MEHSIKSGRGRKYTNGEITVYWKPESCIHASFCYRELIEVFDPSRRPWVDMYGATTAEIIRTVDMCPTDALTWKWNDDEKNKNVDPSHTNHVNFRRPDLLKDETEASSEPVLIRVMPQGPLIISGTFTLKYDNKIKDVEESAVSLCRCGASSRMPFCDGNHRKSDFKDE